MSDDKIYAKYIEELDSLKLFEYAERSEAGRQHCARGRAWMKVPDRWTANLIVVMGRMVHHYPSLLDVALAVVRNVNPHSSVVEWQAKKFAAAREVLAGKYDDVERRSGPESFRYSDCVRQYTREEKLVVLEVLRSFTDSSVPGMGWCAQKLAEELRVTSKIEWLSLQGVRL